MKSSFLDIKNSSTFPLDKIIGVLDWKDDFYSASYYRLLSTSDQRQSRNVPVFLINEKKYLPVEFGREFDGKHFFDTCFDSFDDFFNLVEQFSKATFERVANPIILDSIKSVSSDGRITKTLYGLVPFVEGVDLSKYKFDGSESEIQKTLYEIALASQEFANHDLINLDIHKGNIIKTAESISIIDPSLVKTYFRSRGNHISDRSLYAHYSPEVRFGGMITGKSQTYSVGATLNNIISSELGPFYKDSFIWKKNKKLISACLSKKPSGRPSADELVGLLELV